MDLRLIGSLQCIDSTTPDISRLLLTSVADKPGSSFILSHHSEGMFSHDEAQMVPCSKTMTCQIIEFMLLFVRV